MKTPILGLCGPTGAGKGFIVEELVKRGYPVERIISCTTREKRSDEIHGVHYYFITREDFDAKQERGDFLESGCGKYCYGTLKSEFERIDGLNKIPILEIGHKGMQKMQGILEETVWELHPVGVLPGELSYQEIVSNFPDLQISFNIASGIPEVPMEEDRVRLIKEYQDLLRKRLHLRSTESVEEIEQRLISSGEILEFFLSGSAQEKGFKMISNTLHGSSDPIKELLLRVKFLKGRNEIGNELKLKI